jgi:uncharacterized membrane protein HdeD (DUF308 family)
MSNKPSKKKHGKRFWFWTRFSVWFLLSVITPSAIIITQYEIFSERTSTTKITGMGLIALIALGGGVFYIIKSLSDASHNPWINGMMEGLIKVILPLLGVYLLTGIIAYNLDKIRIILVVSLLAEGLALPINPLPEYVAEQKKKRKLQETIGITSDELKSIAKIAEMATEKEKVK